ncbi:sensor histidine kinase [Halogranum rubrum]|uniref:histidine kinase n=1 Tax=Halogranum salarium B-1 TaxID=1210908 RepID=J2ZKH4_9EURY|nr:PAS domain-containing sensor histidine kinase [Halogranum salarium]EJN61195.1 hypothetical protein HSB1_02360 [Halogranum salarium B-1]
MDRTLTLGAAALDALSLQVTILRADGVIVQTNHAWRTFGVENGLAADATLGMNYLDVCDADGGDESIEIADGVRAVLDGESDEFVFEYRCDGPTDRRWFLMRATPCLVDGERYGVVTHADITDRKLAELEVQRRNDELRNLVHLLAHDIRNPLNIADGWLSELDDADPAVVERIHTSLERIDAIADDVLALMQSEIAATEPTEGSIADHARDVWEGMDTADATLVVEADRIVTCYPKLFDHLLLNIFRNAIHHVGSDVTVTVGTTDCGFFVADDGPGIPEEDRDRLFEPGYTTDTEGTGFGLAIVDSVAAKHGWTVELADVGSGARFEVRTTPSFTASGPLSELLDVSEPAD